MNNQPFSLNNNRALQIKETYLSVMRIEEDATCPEYEEEEDPVFILLRQCPARGRMRYAAIDASDLKEQEIKRLKLKDIFSFIRKTGRFIKEVALMVGGGGGVDG